MYVCSGGRRGSTSVLIDNPLSLLLRKCCSSSPSPYSEVFVSLFVSVRASCLMEKRESSGAFLAASGDGAKCDSGLYMGDVYAEEPGLIAAGVGGKGRSSIDEGYTS